MNRSISISPSTRMGVGVAVLASTTLLLAACSGESAANDDVIVVGTSNGLTGPAAAGCKPTSDGLHAWLEHVNNEGGINGRTFKHIVKDDATDATRTVANVRGLIAEDVVALVGGCGSATSVAAAPIANQAKVPFIAPVAAAEALYNPVQPYVFSIYPSYAEQLGALTRAAIADGNVKSVSLVATERPGWEDVVAAVEKAATDGGAKFLGTQSSALGATEFTAPAVKIKEQQPDLLVSHLGIAESARMITALDTQGFLPPLIIGDNVQASEPWLKAGGNLASGHVKLTSTVPFPTSDAAKPCVDALKAADVTVDLFSLQGCSQGQVFTAAVEEAGDDVTRESIRKALETFSAAEVSILPPLSFSADNHLGLNSLYLVGVEDGELVDTGEVLTLTD